MKQVGDQDCELTLHRVFRSFECNLELLQLINVEVIEQVDRVRRQTVGYQGPREARAPDCWTFHAEVSCFAIVQGLVLPSDISNEKHWMHQGKEGGTRGAADNHAFGR